MALKVLYFSRAAEITRCREEVWELTMAISVEEFWAEAITRHPALESVRASCRLAVDESFVTTTTMIQPGSTVAVLPPVSGG